MSTDATGPSRRDLFRGAALGAAAALPLPLLGAADAKPDPVTEFDFTKDSAALQPDKIVAGACQFCNSLCALQVHLKAGRVIDIRGSTDDPVQAGGLCVKGPMMAQLVYNRHRLTKPLK